MTDIFIHDTTLERIQLLIAIRDVYPGISIDRQRRRMLEVMQKTGHVSTFEAMRVLDVFDPRPRKHELIQLGHDVILKWGRITTESGALHRVGFYLLQAGEQS